MFFSSTSFQRQSNLKRECAKRSAVEQQLSEQSCVKAVRETNYSHVRLKTLDRVVTKSNAIDIQRLQLQLRYRSSHISNRVLREQIAQVRTELKKLGVKIKYRHKKQVSVVIDK